MKLNLGCHNSIRPGYINIDKDKYEGVDVVCDVSKLPFPDNHVNEVYASNVLEHFPHTKTLEVLKEWHRVMAPGSVLKISVPDFDRAIEVYQKKGLCDWIVNLLWGDQIYDGAFHYCAFNEPRLRDLLKKAGFEDISRVERLPGSSNSECSTLVSNIDFKYVCLNMVCVKI